MAQISKIQITQYLLTLSEEEADVLCRLLGHHIIGEGKYRNILNNIYFQLDSAVPYANRGSLCSGELQMEKVHDDNSI